MANEEPLTILKNGVKVWNKWKNDFDRKMDPLEIILNNANLANAKLAGVNLSGVSLYRADLSGADLASADLSGAELGYADLSGVELSRAELENTNFHSANLTKASLIHANLFSAYLLRANLTEVHLSYATLDSANLSGADLSGAKLEGAILNGTDLYGTNFNSARLNGTIFSRIDLSSSNGLESVVHSGSSTLGTNTLKLSLGKIPIEFLRGCGLSDWEIEQAKLYNPALGNDERNTILYKVYELQGSQAIQVSPLFISYSQVDGKFVDKVENQLIKKGIRFWRDIHDMIAGRLENQIDRAIRQNPTVLLVLSEHSLNSDWVEHEVRTARRLEKELGRDVLCPVALDDSWKSSRWPKRIMEQIMEYNILDFSEWQDDVKFEGMFRKLIDGLQLFYKG